MAGPLGGVDNLPSIVSRLQQTLDVRLIQYPSVDEEIETPHDVPALGLKAARQVMQSVSREDSVVLLGLSFGGWVAYEAAQTLEEYGYKVDRVIMADTAAPGKRGRLPWHQRIREQLRYGRIIFHDGLRQPIRLLKHRLPLGAYRRLLTRINRRFLIGKPVQRLALAIGLARRYLSGPMLRFTENRILAEWRQAQAMGWRPSPLAAELTVLKAEEGDACRYRLASHMGWADYACRLEVIELPGDHLGYTREPVLSRLADELNRIFSCA